MTLVKPPKNGSTVRSKAHHDPRFASTVVLSKVPPGETITMEALRVALGAETRAEQKRVLSQVHYLCGTGALVCVRRREYIRPDDARTAMVEKRLARPAYRDRTPEEIAASDRHPDWPLVDRLQAGDGAAGAELLMRHAGQLQRVANMYTRLMAFEDVYQEACIGFLHGLKKCQRGRGSVPYVYALLWARAVASRAASCGSNDVYVPLRARRTREAAIMERPYLLWGKSLSAPMYSTSGDPYTLEETLVDSAPRVDDDELRSTAERQNRGDALVSLMGQLSGRDAVVLRARFGIGTADGESETLESIGGRLGLSRERVRQIEGSAMARLKKLASSLDSSSPPTAIGRPVGPYEKMDEIENKKSISLSSSVPRRRRPSTPRPQPSWQAHAQGGVIAGVVNDLGVQDACGRTIGAYALLRPDPGAERIRVAVRVLRDGAPHMLFGSPRQWAPTRERAEKLAVDRMVRIRMRFLKLAAAAQTMASLDAQLTARGK